MKYREIVTLAGINIMKLTDIIIACKRTTEVFEVEETEREREQEAKSIVAVEDTEWWERR